MPRDKNKIHRATSDVEDEVISDEEPVVNPVALRHHTAQSAVFESIGREVDSSETRSWPTFGRAWVKEQQSEIPSKLEDPNVILEERKKHLKDAILKRTLALKQQRERGRSQKVNSTTQKY